MAVCGIIWGHFTAMDQFLVPVWIIYSIVRTSSTEPLAWGSRAYVIKHHFSCMPGRFPYVVSHLTSMEGALVAGIRDILHVWKELNNRIYNILWLRKGYFHWVNLWSSHRVALWNSCLIPPPMYTALMIQQLLWIIFRSFISRLRYKERSMLGELICLGYYERHLIFEHEVSV